MKIVGIVRKIDKLGRVVIPKEIRDTMGVSEGSPVEIIQTDEGMFVKKAQPVSMDIIEYICDELCRYPQVIKKQEDLDEICKKCKLVK